MDGEARQPALLTPLEVARELRCSRSKVYELLATGGIPGAIKIGGSVRVSRTALERWIARSAGEPIQAA